MVRHVDPNDCIRHWGGEEFILVQPNKTAKIAAAQADSIRAAIEATPMPGIGRVTASFGISSLDRKESLDSVLKRTDEPLYQAKREGKNKICLAEPVHTNREGNPNGGD